MENPPSNKKAVVIFTSIISVILIILLIMFSVLYVRFHQNNTIIPENQKFNCPNFENEGTLVNINSKQLYNESLNNLSNYYYVGTLDGVCSFEKDKEIKNTGIELVKHYNNEIYSYCQTKSVGFVPVIGNTTINSAKRYHYDSITLYECEIADKNRFVENEQK